VGTLSARTHRGSRLNLVIQDAEYLRKAGNVENAHGREGTSDERPHERAR
jgi:hypothetical protein